MARVKILGTAITSSHGTLSAGDIVNVSESFAAHLVNDCKIAEYLDAEKPAQTSQKTENPRKTKSKQITRD